MAAMFREKALKKISSPEQLDALLEITPPRHWLVISGVGLVLLAIIFWGIFGSVPTRIAGAGQLIHSGGLFRVTTAEGGRVQYLYCMPGDVVNNGQLIAVIEQPELYQQIRNMRSELSDFNREESQMVASNQDSLRLSRDSYVQQRAIQLRTIKILESKMSWLLSRVTQEEQLVKDGLITRQQVFNSKQEYDQSAQSISNASNELQRIEIDEQLLLARQHDSLQNLQSRMAETRRSLALLEKRYTEASSVTSPYRGTVVEVPVYEGMMLGRGSTLATVELEGRDVSGLTGIMYVPAAEGKKIKFNMSVQLSPSTVRQEEFGTMVAVVTYVSAFPATREAMQSVLENDTLVAQLMAAGAPLEVHVELIPDPRTSSGYKWSSGRGPAIGITPGTLFTGSVVVDRQVPINLVIPYIKKKALGIGEDGN